MVKLHSVLEKNPDYFTSRPTTIGGRIHRTTIDRSSRKYVTMTIKRCRELSRYFLFVRWWWWIYTEIIIYPVERERLLINKTSIKPRSVFLSYRIGDPDVDSLNGTGQEIIKVILNATGQDQFH